MSFIYENDELIKLLIKEGEDFEKKFAQTTKSPEGPTGPVSAETEASYNLAKKLLIDLQRQIDPANAPPKSLPLGVPNDVGADLSSLKVENLRSLGDFLQWTANAKLTWGGQRLAWTEEQAATDKPPEEAWIFPVWTVDRKRDEDTREPVKITAYAMKPQLIEFLKFLRDSQEAKNNKVFQVMLNKIISQTNEFLDKAEQISTKAKPAGAKLSLNPEAIVDALPSDTLDPANPLAGITGYPTFGNVKSPALQLKVKDLNDISSFTAWLRFKKVMIKDDSGKSITPGVLNPDGDPCIAVNILYQRAKYLSSVAYAGDKIVPDYSKMVKLYLEKVQEYGGTFTGKNGNPCAVISPGTTAGEFEEKPKGVEFTSDVKFTGLGGTKPVTSQMLNQVAQSLPLDLNDIDFSRIKRFFDSYLAVLQNTESAQKEQVEAAWLRVESAMRACSTLTKDGMINFPLYGGPDVVVQWLKPPVGSSYLVFLANLKAVVESTARTIQMFYNAYARQRSPEDRVIFNEFQKAAVEAQILGYSIFKQNWNKLASLESRRNEVVTFK